MLVTSLPIPYNGQIRCTWEFFSQDDAFRSHTLAWLKQNGCNAIVALTNNTGPGPFSIFKNNVYGGKVDRDKLALIVKWARQIHDAGGYFIPCLFCDADKSLVEKTYAHIRYVTLLEQAIGEYVAGWIIWLEGSEVISRAALAAFAAYLKDNVTDKPVGSHGVYSKAGDPGNLDFWANEFSWPPQEGDAHSVDDAVNEGKQVIAASGLPILFLEDCWNPLSPASRAHARALAQLQGCAGVGSPM